MPRLYSTTAAACLALELQLVKADVEAQYQKKLQSLATKASKVAVKSVGSLQSSWNCIMSCLNSEAEYHKGLAETLSNQISKPLKAHGEEMYKERKNGEANVERALKAFNERRSKETSSRNAAYNRCKEVETMTEMVEATKSDKEAFKIGKALKKAEELAKKVDKEYRRDCIESENLRLAWEHNMFSFCERMENVAQTQTAFCRDVFGQYCSSVEDKIPVLQQSVEQMRMSLNAIDEVEDIKLCCSLKGTGSNTAEHVLYHCFAEDESVQINEERRIQSLRERCAFFFQECRKNEEYRDGLVSPSGIGTPEADLEQQAKINSSVDHVQACLYKLRKSLAVYDGSSCPSYPLSNQIETRPAAKGQVPVTVMNIPLTNGIGREASPGVQDLHFDIGNIPLSPTQSIHDRNSVSSCSSQTSTTKSRRRINFSTKKKKDTLTVDSARGTSVSMANVRRASSVDVYETPTAPTAQASATAPTSPTENHPNFHEEDIDDQSEFDDDPSDTYARPLEGCEQCRALYDFDATEDAELTIHEGDIIDITSQPGEGWWEGRLNGKIGCFPESYVEMI
ncbi:protein kinase C and casein kinase substrate in neurons protein 2-like isoform X2 [Sycon ciliatum]|uniref:protein kinase C and casein kinase substrate in neurons protein 2-like isoform X2 n=1 Tax=Sycon ciliatum TaxID=27933 RepID=UPI0031F603C1|eukprot:scpid70583/ scgid4311/ Endophilin-A2; Endophilin-2; SH3 domain protein 2B; SH3 domain-containing GRB2-like protein 1